MWKDLKKDDSLYILVSEINSDGIKSYKYQTTKVISNKSYNSISKLKFKYTDETNHRRRVEIIIDNDTDDYIIINCFDSEIIISYVGKLVLQDFLFEKISQKQKETKQLILDSELPLS